jgi:hypothetical protein
VIEVYSTYIYIYIYMRQSEGLTSAAELCGISTEPEEKGTVVAVAVAAESQ